MAMTKTIQATVKNRTDTAANWTQKNPVLAEGEIIVVQTSAGETRLKIGDGVKTFTQLPYIDEQIYNNVVTSVNGQTGDVTLSDNFIVNVTSADDINCTLDKTFDQIQEAVQAGKKVYAKLNGVFTIYMPMVLQTSFVLIFAATAFTSESIEQYVLTVPKSNSDGNNPQFFKKSAVTYNSDSTTGEKTMPQVYMSEDPVNNMQIATKKYVDDSTFNTVLYTAQTLTDEQKKQARNNIEAADADFVITATVASDNTCTLDKTFDQIREAISKGKRVFAVIKFGGDGGLILPLFNSTSTEIQFTGFDYNNGLNRAQTYKLVVTTNESVIAAGSAPMLTVDNTLRQVEMEANPSFDMEIATKKYVDDKISNKEFILSSSTAGSTKKFKLTIDDTGTLTASEITA